MLIPFDRSHLKKISQYYPRHLSMMESAWLTDQMRILMHAGELDLESEEISRFLQEIEDEQRALNEEAADYPDPRKIPREHWHYPRKHPIHERVKESGYRAELEEAVELLDSIRYDVYITLGLEDEFEYLGR